MEYHERRIAVANLAAMLLSRNTDDLRLPAVLVNDQDPYEVEQFDEVAWPYLSAAIRMANTILDNAVIRHKK